MSLIGTETSFAAAMRDFFGMLPEKKLADFMIELKALTTEDREFFRAELIRVGYTLKA